MNNDWEVDPRSLQVRSKRPKQSDQEMAREARKFRVQRAAEAEITITAWRCDNCRKYQPVAIPSTILYVEDSGPMRDSGPVVKARSRFIQRMITCPPCARTLGYERKN